MMKYFKYGLIFSLTGDVLMVGSQYSRNGNVWYRTCIFIKSFGTISYNLHSIILCMFSYRIIKLYIKELLLRVAVILYALLATATILQTNFRLQHSPSLASLLGAFGGRLFGVSDLFPGMVVFKYKRASIWCGVIIMTTYYMAQLLLTILVVNYE